MAEVPWERATLSMSGRRRKEQVPRSPHRQVFPTTGHTMPRPAGSSGHVQAGLREGASSVTGRAAAAPGAGLEDGADGPQPGTPWVGGHVGLTPPQMAFLTG